MQAPAKLFGRILNEFHRDDEVISIDFEPAGGDEYQSDGKCVWKLEQGPDGIYRRTCESSSCTTGCWQFDVKAKKKNGEVVVIHWCVCKEEAL